MRHMTLEEWDRRVAPFLATIKIRATHVHNDAKQIGDWVDLLPVAPDFQTEAIAKLEEAHFELQGAVNKLRMAIFNFHQKEKVK